MFISNFNKVQEFMDVAGQDTKTRDFSSSLVAFRKSLIDEEVSELAEAIRAHDFHETVDALTDILFVCYGFFEVLGVDADVAFHEVYRSNMSKFCDTEEDAQKSVEYYKTLKDSPYDSPVYEKRGKYWIIFNKSTGKILKNVKWIHPNFSCFD